jgi:hypothetical protein
MNKVFCSAYPTPQHFLEELRVEQGVLHKKCACSGPRTPSRAGA